MRPHLFVSEADGGLYDTRDTNWSRKPALRANYSRAHRTVDNLADLKAALRNGGFAWPGGYPLVFTMKDGGALAFKTVESEFATICRAVLDGYPSGWIVAGCDINYESGWIVAGCNVNYESGLYADHTGERLESAYGDVDSSEED